MNAIERSKSTSRGNDQTETREIGEYFYFYIIGLIAWLTENEHNNHKIKPTYIKYCINKIIYIIFIRLKKSFMFQSKIGNFFYIFQLTVLFIIKIFNSDIINNYIYLYYIYNIFKLL